MTITVETAREEYQKATAAAKAARTAQIEVDDAWQAVRTEWGEKQNAALENVITANGLAWQAQMELNIAIANAAAATVTDFDMESFKREIGTAFRVRSAEKRDRWIEAVLRKLTRTQTTNNGFSEDSLRSISIQRDPRGGIGRENMQWMNPRQTEKVWAILQARCPVREDNGALAPPYPIGDEKGDEKTDA